MRVQTKVAEKGKRHAVSRLFHAKSDKDTINTWRFELTRVLHLFHVRPVTPVRILPTSPSRQN